MPDSANHLVGEVLPGGWTVLQKVSRKGTTGGHFSVGYIVQHTGGNRGFLKALDLERAFRSADISRALQTITEAFNFERELLEVCKDSRMSRVVVAIDQGQHTLKSRPDSHPVQYIIFELATTDVRKQSNVNRFSPAVYFRLLHHVATGLHQLHTADIAHQDLKPSNVLVFQGDEGKIADLGRSSVGARRCATDALTVPGDLNYAPVELLYKEISSNREVRRKGCDFYLLGSLLYFMITGVMLTPDLLSRVDEKALPQQWKGSFQQVLPHLQVSFEECVDEMSSYCHPTIRNRVIDMFRFLSDPDPQRRGDQHRKFSGDSPLKLERCISIFDLLARRSAVTERSAFTQNAPC